MPLVTVHPTGNNWRAFEFDACVCTTTVADILSKSLFTEFKRGIVTELYVHKPFIAVRFTKTLPASWSIKVLEAAQAYIKMTRQEYKEVLLHIVPGE